MLKNIILIFLVIILFLFYPIILSMIIGQTLILKDISSNKNIKSSFLFIFEDYNISIADKYNFVKEIHYNIYNNIDVQIKNNHRTVYIHGGAILKTYNDSIDVENNGIKVGGYMGIFFNKKIHFFVDKNAKFSCYNGLNQKQDNPCQIIQN